MNFFNNYDDSIQWTIPQCDQCLIPEVICKHYDHLEFLDCSISWKQINKGNIFVWQFQVKSFSKATDCHSYLAPSSCSAPHLNSKGVSLAKTVGTRLRTLHTNDHALLNDLNLFSGYMIARGYQETSIKYHLASMANRSRSLLLQGQYQKHRSFVLPLVTILHPSITVLTNLAKRSLQEATIMDPALQFIIPKTSLVVAYKKLPSLQLLLCRNDQNSLAAGPTSSSNHGYLNTGCNCLVCQVSLFGKYVRSPSLPGFLVRIPATVTCRSGPALVYHIVCASGRPECELAHYVGMASSSDKSVFPMHARWSNHKSQSKKRKNFCKLVNHLISFHRGEDPQKFMKITILQAAETPEEALLLETYWARRLFAFKPSGLNVREEDKSLE